ncbi:ABC transporter permease [Acidicapsa acidisoli]|uniref:ABC transporter permease n=1 Tax=Acidicapsa acidisoli TaxID=1615681 RepID=UPI0021DFBD46|nr:ABC transporter permease [Acidicapsa acidisoli]
MNLPLFFASILRTLRRNPWRALLMMAGVAVGIAALTILTSIGESTRRETMKRFKNMLGTFDTILIRPGSSKNRGMVSLTNVEPSLKFEDAKAIAAELPEIRQVAEVQNAFDIDVKYRDRNCTPSIFGVSSNWLELRGDQLAQGVFFSEDDVRSLARVAILGSDAQQRLFPGEDPVGKNIEIGNVPFVVRGVMVSRGAGPAGGSLDNLIFIPVTTASKRLFNRDFLTMMIAQLKDPTQGQEAIDHLATLLRSRHHIAPGALDDFNLSNPRAVMDQVTAMGSTFEKLLSIVAVLATGIGGIVIMSITLIGVSERRKEIGVRRAVGASRPAILAQFLFEAVLLALGGGMTGVATGVGGTQIISRLQHLPFLIQPGAMLLAITLSIALGLVFGVYPALKAAGTNPIDALRE